MWESLLRGSVGVVVAGMVGLTAPIWMWRQSARTAEQERRDERLAEHVGLVRARAFAVTEAAEQQFRLNPFYRPLVQLSEAVFALTAVLPADDREVVEELERRLGALGRAIRRHRRRRWLPGGSNEVVAEALAVAACAQAWQVERASRVG